MNKYQALLEGKNFLIESEGKLQKHGFYTTRYIEAKNPEEAELKAVETIKNDRELIDAVKNERSNPPMIYLEELYELESFEGLNSPETGYSFYIDDGND